MQLILLAGSSSGGPTLGSSDQADILMPRVRRRVIRKACYTGYPGWTCMPRAWSGFRGARAGQVGHRGTSSVAVKPSSFHIYDL